jgi:hypothetical protein
VSFPYHIQEKINELIDALRVNSDRWSYIETQVMENLDIDLDLDIVQEPLQNLALSQLLLAELSFGQGRAAAGYLGLRRGCSVRALLRADENTPPPYSQKALEKRCTVLLDKHCPTQHPTMNDHEESCLSIYEAISANKELRRSLLGNSKRVINLLVDGRERKPSGAAVHSAGKGKGKGPLQADSTAAGDAGKAGGEKPIGGLGPKSEAAMDERRYVIILFVFNTPRYAA